MLSSGVNCASTHLLLRGIDRRGYLGLRGSLRVLGRWNLTVVLIFFTLVPRGPCTTYTQKSSYIKYSLIIQILLREDAQMVDVREEDAGEERMVMQDRSINIQICIQYFHI